MTFTESFDLPTANSPNGAPVCAYQIGANALNHILFAVYQVIDEIKTTDENGFCTVENAPILDTNGDKTITEADVSPRNNSTGAQLYVGTAAGDVLSNEGKFKLYSDAGLTTPVVSTEVKTSYWTLKPVMIDNEGKLTVIVGSSVLPTGAATQATLAEVLAKLSDNPATETTLISIKTAIEIIDDIIGSAGEDSPAKGCLIMGSDGTKARILKIDQCGSGMIRITNDDGLRHAYIHGSLGDSEAFVESLATTAFLLQYNPDDDDWERFRGNVQTQGRTKNVTATIANGEQASDEIDTEGYKLAALHMPSSWTAADISFKASATSGGTYNPIKDIYGQAVTITVAEGTAVSLGEVADILAPFRYIKLYSSVAQGAERLITMSLKG